MKSDVFVEKVINHCRPVFISYKGEVEAINFEFDNKKRRWIIKFITYLLLKLSRTEQDRFPKKSDPLLEFLSYYIYRHDNYLNYVKEDEESLESNRRFTQTKTSRSLSFRMKVKQEKLRIDSIFLFGKGIYFSKEDREQVNKVLRHNDHQFNWRDKDLSFMLLIHRKEILKEVIHVGTSANSELKLQIEMKTLEKELKMS